ncbi:hypothetical protein GJ744_004796 [Endocarpon pusillum]|uniref:Uncharacterized protein n=1 Tax=Endocarpon pusillum TaxID=364733 RepID=A0A8H7A5D0_9EURO|nr:hypothetical protein GJ744_004796 [Endocarpon pusillum]
MILRHQGLLPSFEDLEPVYQSSHLFHWWLRLTDTTEPQRLFSRTYAYLEKSDEFDQQFMNSTGSEALPDEPAESSTEYDTNSYSAKALQHLGYFVLSLRGKAPAEDASPRMESVLLACIPDSQLMTSTIPCLVTWAALLLAKQGCVHNHDPTSLLDPFVLALYLSPLRIGQKQFHEFTTFLKWVGYWYNWITILRGLKTHCLRKDYD